MSKKIAFQSNTKGKLQKIVNGDVFSDVFTVVTELFQNSYRALAKNVYIEVDEYEGIMRFSDDGVGCKKPENIITLDYSEWESTQDGFGIGLLSCLALPRIKYAIIKSHNWKLNININELLEGENPLADVERFEEKEKGFSVEIKSQYITENAYWLEDRIKSDGELQPYNVYLNGVLVPKKDLFCEVCGDFTMEFDNRMFSAKLCVAQSHYDYPYIYYEKRKVECAYSTGGNITGVIELKKGAVSLQEPDRKNIVRNEKRDRLYDELKKCKRKLYLEFVKTAGSEILEKYANAVAEILNVDDYENIIQIDDICEEVIDEKRDVSDFSEQLTKSQAFEMLMNNINTKNESSQISLFEEQKTEIDVQNVTKLLNYFNTDSNRRWVKTDNLVEDTSSWYTTPLTEDMIGSLSCIVINGLVWENRSVDELTTSDQTNIEDHFSEVDVSVKVKKKKKKKVSEIIKSSKKKVWLKASEVEAYADLKAKAEYYEVKVFLAKNIMYEKVFEKHNIPHISELSAGMKIHNYVSNAGAKTNKEEAYMKILEMVCKYYKLPSNTFNIADLKMVIETWLAGRVIDREVVKNSKGKIRVKGLCEEEDGYIYLDRKALGLQRFSLTNEFGKNHYRAILGSLKTISHELAHLLYKTIDNTTEHFNKESEIFDELENYFNSL